MRHVYSLIHYLFMPCVAVYLLWRGIRNRDYWHRWGERLGFIPARRDPGRLVWVHAVSVGEVQAASALVKSLQERYPESRLLVTTTTPTGSDRVRQVFGDTVAHFYLPYDIPGAVRRFLDRSRPAIAIILETELWPNLFHHCHRGSIPILLANVRLSERSAVGYRKVGGFVREMLSKVSLIAAQTEADCDRLLSLGVDPKKVRVTGSVKFDVHSTASLREQAQAIRRAWGADRGVWIAASTHEGEDEQVLDAFARVLRRLPNCLLVLVPRHPERFSRVAALCRKRGYYTAVRSERPRSAQHADIYIGDTMGELPLFYAASDVAFVGGSLVEIGGHNALEPASLGIPVVMGPHVFNFAEIVRCLCERGACVQVEDSLSLADAVVGFLGDANLRHSAGQKGKEFVDENRGARDRVVGMVAEILSPDLPGSEGGATG